MALTCVSAEMLAVLEDDFNNSLASLVTYCEMVLHKTADIAALVSIILDSPETRHTLEVYGCELFFSGDSFHVMLVDGGCRLDG